MEMGRSASDVELAVRSRFPAPPEIQSLIEYATAGSRQKAISH